MVQGDQINVCEGEQKSNMKDKTCFKPIYLNSTCLFCRGQYLTPPRGWRQCDIKLFDNLH